MHRGMRREYEHEAGMRQEAGGQEAGGMRHEAGGKRHGSGRQEV
jgi:hypothetical protein